jgi:coenzyme F420-0:L-glutamate ligase/coenzyme F420-1:gamma-L-glutamate ligase
VLTGEQQAYLLQHRVARLATVGSAGEPHVVPVCFAVAGGLIYTPLDGKPKQVAPERLRRVRDLERNPSLCLVVDDYHEDWTRLRWLQVRGTGSLLQPGEEQQRAIEALRNRYEQYRTMALEQAPVIRLTPLRVVGWAWSGRTG